MSRASTRMRRAQWKATAPTLVKTIEALEPSGILANDEHVALFLRVTGERNGKRLDIEMAEAMDVGADGLWTAFFAMADDQQAVDEFWS